ncbi:MAG: penicillin-insensitive murein endopeptidase [Myxococcota bacterium]
MKLRSLALLTLLLICSGRVATAGEPLGLNEDEWPTVGVADRPMVTLPTETLPFSDDVSTSAMGAVDPDGLHEVYWTVDVDDALDALASRWGMLRRDLVRLNPQLRGQDRVAAGVRLRVYEYDAQLPTQSVGSPNNGRLRHGLPMPEGPYWTLRERRTRAFGARNAVLAMVAAFNRYGESFDDAPPVSVGELSYRRGGRALPHRSHRTGRDVDLGYVLTPGSEGKYWKRANVDNFDVEKNWVLIQSLVETGEVQQIFISSRLQRLLRPLAREQLSDEEFARYFWVTGGGEDQSPILRHWDGHRDHMHVRFRCEDGNSRCRSRSVHRHSA